MVAAGRFFHILYILYILLKLDRCLKIHILFLCKQGREGEREREIQLELKGGVGRLMQRTVNLGSCIPLQGAGLIRGRCVCVE